MEQSQANHLGPVGQHRDLWAVHDLRQKSPAPPRALKVDQKEDRQVQVDQLDLLEIPDGKLKKKNAILYHYSNVEYAIYSRSDHRLQRSIKLFDQSTPVYAPISNGGCKEYMSWCWPKEQERGAK